ncbi:hypothetical protein AHAS_Ahas13G0294300 [Arachis hypogaea]
MANDLPNNDHTSGIEDGTPTKNTDATPPSPKEANPSKKDKLAQNVEILDAIREQQERLKQLEQEVERQREVERDLRKETKQHRELEEKLQKLEADVKAKTTRSDRDTSPHREQDPFTREIMKAKVLKDFKAPDMTRYDRTSDPSHHLSNFRS